MSKDVGVSPPIEEGETYEVKIEDIGKEGDGVAKIEDFVVFIPNVDVGEEVKVKITRVLRTLAFGEVVDRDVEVEEIDETPDLDEVNVKSSSNKRKDQRSDETRFDHCGTKNDSDATYCKSCGNKLSSETGTEVW